jgi:hypothetical protein
MRVREETISGFAWCPDGMCDGNVQQHAEVIRQEIEYTMFDSGGDDNKVEKGFVYLRFADGEDHTCDECGRQLEVGDQERPVYPGTNWDPDGLRQLIRDGVTVAKGKQESPELEAMREQLAAMQAQLNRQNEEPAKRGPGRPPKQPQEA